MTSQNMTTGILLTCQNNSYMCILIAVINILCLGLELCNLEAINDTNPHTTYVKQDPRKHVVCRPIHAESS